jgi:hypothetical protein
MGNLCSCLKFSRTGYSEVPTETQSLSKSQHNTPNPAVYSALSGTSSEKDSKSASETPLPSNSLPQPPAVTQQYSSYAAGGSGSPTAAIVIPDAAMPEPKEYSSSLTTQSKSAFFAKYELRDEIGVGSTSKCYKCVRKADGTEFACKVIGMRILPIFLFFVG